MNDLVLLLEAMGYRPTSDGGWDGAIRKYTGEYWTGPLTHISYFNPFEDANADYKVLEWMRNRGLDDPLFLAFAEMVGRTRLYEYQIGDYARAALRVINRE